PCGEGLGVGVAVGGHISRNDNYPPPQPSPTRAGLSHMEKLRPYFTLRDGSDRRGNSVVPHWIRFCSGFDSVAVCRQREGLPSIRANTTRAKPYAIALPKWGYASFCHHPIFWMGHIFLDNRCGSFGSGAICTVHGPR